MKTTRLSLVCTVLFCLLATMFAADEKAAPAPLGLSAILARHRAAQGLGKAGREKLKGMNAIRVTRRITHTGAASWNDYCEAKVPDRIRTEKGDGTVTIDTVSFSINVDKSGGINRRPPEKFNDSVIAMCLINPSKSAVAEPGKVRMVGKDRDNGKLAYHVIASDHVGDYDEWIDAKDFTLVQRKQSGVILNTEETWSDFRDVSGLKVPFEHVTKNNTSLNPWTEDEQLVNLDFAPQINDADFADTSTKPTMGSGSAQAQSSGPSMTATIGGQPVTVNADNVLAVLSGRQQQQTQQPQQQPQQSGPQPADQSQPQTQQDALAKQVAQAAAKGQVPSSATGTPVVRQSGHGQVVSPSCSDATNMVAIDEVATGYKDPNADMRFTVTNTSGEDLYVDRVNCRDTSVMKPRESKRCIYSSASGWVVVVARNRDIAGGGACSDATKATSAAQETKLGFGH